MSDKRSLWSLGKGKLVSNFQCLSITAQQEEETKFDVTQNLTT